MDNQGNSSQYLKPFPIIYKAIKPSQHHEITKNAFDQFFNSTIFTRQNMFLSLHEILKVKNTKIP